VILGLWLMMRPLSSIILLLLVIGLTLIFNGIGELTQPRAAWHSLIGAASLIVMGVCVFAFRGFTTSALAVFIAAASIISGVLRVVDAIRNEREEKAASILMATAAIVAGVIAFAWPDLTLLVGAVAFGGWTTIFGGRLAWSAIALRRHKHVEVGISDATPARRAKFSHWARLIGAAAMLAIVVFAAILSVRLHQGVPDPDDFYAAPVVTPSEPGVLVRAEPFTRGIPVGARAWRILYTTTKGDGEPALASGLVIAPNRPSTESLPLVAWAHGTTGYAQVCAPSLLPNPLIAGAMFTMDQVIAHGWALVATDYIGLGTKGPHPYLIGQGEARSTLDSIRAAHELRTLHISSKTVVWGHSQGGHAALWTGGLAAAYAPELDIDGVAALAPASDLESLVSNLGAVRGGILFAAYALAGYDAAYDDVRDTDYVDPSAQTLMRELSRRCLADPRTYVSVIEALAIANDRDVYSHPLTTGSMLKHLQENTPTLPIRPPLLIAQGLADPLVVPNVQQQYVQTRCKAGQALEYLTIPGKDHVALVEADSPLIPRLLRWTEDRFAGAPAIDSCRSTSPAANSTHSGTTTK
jgi:uncharacterized membrane protein HdeD (DUF308 family)